VSIEYFPPSSQILNDAYVDIEIMMMMMKIIIIIIIIIIINVNVNVITQNYFIARKRKNPEMI